MTHTLNRTGISPARPGEEIVVLVMAHHKIKGQKGTELSDAARIVLKHEPDNFIGTPMGLTPEQIIPLAAMTGIVTAVFNNKQVVTDLVKELKAKKPGLSVVLSGLFSDVRDICQEAGLTEHTSHLSAGIFGRTENLPDTLTLNITTQCGHGLVSPHYVKDVIRRIRKGKLTSAEAADLLSKPCVCGIVNKKRTEKLLDQMVDAASSA
jgi:hypothetical protein